MKGKRQSVGQERVLTLCEWSQGGGCGLGPAEAGSPAVSRALDSHQRAQRFERERSDPTRFFNYLFGCAVS